MQLRYPKEYHDHFILEEGKRLVSYTDTKGLWTIGIGHLLGRSDSFKNLRWTEEKVLTVFENDLDICRRTAYEIFPEFDTFSAKTRLGILDMIFNMGPTGFRAFKQTIRLLHARQFKEAAENALKSKWARLDVPNRAKRVAKLLEG